GRQSCLPLLAHVALIPFFDRGIFKGATLADGDGMPIVELLPGLVSAELHALDLSHLEGVHSYAAHERDMDAQTAMSAGAVKTDEGAEFWRCLGDDVTIH